MDQATERPSGEAGVAGLRAGYRAHLDGLRALSVVLVVAFHADVAQLAGGFVGVDVFFVLSGYLVTGLLVQELTATDRLVLRRFYARRVRRLLPMAMLVLAVTAVVFAVLAAPVLVDDAAGGFRAAFLYVSNWYFIGQSTDYFAGDIEASPILHFWSLSVEEQFYLVWPLAFLALWAVLRRSGEKRMRLAAAVIAVVGVGSLLAAHQLGQTNLERAYYGTDTRAYQLLAGATLALLPTLASRWRSRVVCEALGWAGLGVIAVLSTSLVEVSPIARGTAVVVGALGVLVALESATNTSVRRMLSLGPLVWVGTLSYSIYLWHLPVIFVLRDQAPSTSDLVVFVVATAASLGLAAASAWLLENPIRRTSRLDPIPIPVVVAGLTMSVIGAVAIVPVLSGVSGSTSPDDLDWAAARADAAPVTSCVDSTPADCIVVEGSGPHVALVGDSHVRVWQSAFEELARERDWQLSVVWGGGCSWHRDASVARAADQMERCYRDQELWYDEVIPELDPDYVVLTHRAVFDPAAQFLANEQVFQDSARQVVTLLVDDGRQVIILEPLPITGAEDDPLACLSDGGSDEDCGFDATEEPTLLEVLYRSLADADDAVVSVDADAIQCPGLPRCDALDGSTIVMRDQSHMTGTYARSQARALEELLEGAGALPR